MISNVDLAFYGVSRAKDFGIRDFGAMAFGQNYDNMCLPSKGKCNSRMLKSFHGPALFFSYNLQIESKKLNGNCNKLWIYI